MTVTSSFFTFDETLTGEEAISFTVAGEDERDAVGAAFPLVSLLNRRISASGIGPGNSGLKLLLLLLLLGATNPLELLGLIWMLGFSWTGDDDGELCVRD